MAYIPATDAAAPTQHFQTRRESSMKHALIALVVVICIAAAMVHGKDSPATPGAGAAPGAAAVQNHGTQSFQYGGANLDAAELVGAEIWFKATQGNERFFTYAYPQRLGVAIDWFRVLNTASRLHRFNNWGLINDPECCTPGDPDCPAKSDDETYGLDYCPGDDVLLTFVGKTGYRDPACDLKDAPVEAGPHGPADQRQSACDLRFGTSTGAMGLRKFPNP